MVILEVGEVNEDRLSRLGRSLGRSYIDEEGHQLDQATGSGGGVVLE